MTANVTNNCKAYIRAISGKDVIPLNHELAIYTIKTATAEIDQETPHSRALLAHVVELCLFGEREGVKVRDNKSYQ